MLKTYQEEMQDFLKNYTFAQSSLKLYLQKHNCWYQIDETLLTLTL